jgi:hypothetical protein
MPGIYADCSIYASENMMDQNNLETLSPIGTLFWCSSIFLVIIAVLGGVLLSLALMRSGIYILLGSSSMQSFLVQHHVLS